LHLTEITENENVEADSEYWNYPTGPKGRDAFESEKLKNGWGGIFNHAGNIEDMRGQTQAQIMRMKIEAFERSLCILSHTHVVLLYRGWQENLDARIGGDKRAVAESDCQTIIQFLSNINCVLASTIAIDHRTWKTGLPVRSAVLKPCAGRLVVGWVTTSEYRLLIVFGFLLPRELHEAVLATVAVYRRFPYPYTLRQRRESVCAGWCVIYCGTSRGSSPMTALRPPITVKLLK
jgi:hypothetical protein